MSALSGEEDAEEPGLVQQLPARAVPLQQRDHLSAGCHPAVVAIPRQGKRPVSHGRR